MGSEMCIRDSYDTDKRIQGKERLGRVKKGREDVGRVKKHPRKDKDKG